VPDLKEKVGIKIRELREKYGLTQQELADKSGTSKVTIWSIENGSTATNLDLLEAIAKALKIDPAHLVQPSSEERSEVKISVEKALSVIQDFIRLKENLDSERKALVDVFKKASPRDRELAMNILDPQGKLSNEKKSKKGS
jgi:transcriptional regulator with XRE-family HTH domain